MSYTSVLFEVLPLQKVRSVSLPLWPVLLFFIHRARIIRSSMIWGSCLFHVQLLRNFAKLIYQSWGSAAGFMRVSVVCFFFLLINCLNCKSRRLGSQLTSVDLPGRVCGWRWCVPDKLDSSSFVVPGAMGPQQGCAGRRGRRWGVGWLGTRETWGCYERCKNTGTFQDKPRRGPGTYPCLGLWATRCPEQRGAVDASDWYDSAPIWRVPIIRCSLEGQSFNFWFLSFFVGRCFHCEKALDLCLNKRRLKVSHHAFIYVYTHTHTLWVNQIHIDAEFVSESFLKNRKLPFLLWPRFQLHSLPNMSEVFNDLVKLPSAGRPQRRPPGSALITALRSLQLIACILTGPSLHYCTRLKSSKTGLRLGFYFMS